MYLCSWSCRRTAGGPRGSTSPAPADPARRGPARRAPRRRGRPADGGRRRRARTRSRRDPRMTNFTSSCALQQIEVRPVHARPPRRCPGTSRRRCVTTGAGTSATLMWPPVSSSTVVPARRAAAAISGIASFCSSGSPPVSSTSGTPSASTRGQHVVDRHLLAAGEGVGRVAPRAAQIAGRQPHEHAGPARVRRFALDGGVDLEDRQHARSLRLYRTEPGLQSTPCAIPRSASARPAGATRPGPGAWTGIVYPARARPGQGVRRAARLRRALRHRRGELDLLPDPDHRRRRGAGSSGRRRASSSR